MLERDGVPSESLPWYSFALELGEVAAEDLTETLLEVGFHDLEEMLASDPLNIFKMVPLPAIWANCCFTVRVRDHLRLNSALRADSSELIGHSTVLPHSDDTPSAPSKLDNR